MELGRRSFLGLLGGITLGACVPFGRRVPVGPLGRRVDVWSCFDLPPGSMSRELSGIAYDADTGHFWAVQDASAAIVEIVPDAQLRSFRVSRVVDVAVDGPVDLEGIVLLPDGFIVASEAGPRVLELDRSGRLRKEIILPPKLSEAVKNKSLESLGLSQDGRFLFTASEAALPRDGTQATEQVGTRVRIVRIDRVNGEVTEHAYSTDTISPAGGDYGVADVTAIDATNLLVLERGWASHFGNTVRVYRVDLNDSRSLCQLTPTLGDLTPMLEKRLFIDFARLRPPAGVPAAKQIQSTPLLDNFEGLCLGPRLPDGRRSLVFIADDNGRSDQNARILVLAIS